ncbi:OmpP1/FadL family transporter [Acinetobacter sp.]|uniref:OmpP1/FadL family transporter n=1 Tax=Acinetobacter sp. TaxID=472 RepID=UPI00282E18A7|nr:outer membrane protein transport protein [Acinetobacter sp.]
MYSHNAYYTVLILAVSPFLTTIYAAALDRSGQPITDFLQEGTYASASYNYVIPQISGQDMGLGHSGVPQNIPNITKNYSSVRGGLKTDLNENISIGLLYDQPFSINLQHHGQSDFVSQSLNDLEQGTNAILSSHNLTALVGLNLNKYFNIYAGPAIEEIQGKVQLRGHVYKGMANYNAELDPDYATGWVIGLNIKKPELGLKTALTYRSEIKHKTESREQFSALNDDVYISPITFTSPKSVNFDSQIGLSKQILLTANVRWVPWKDFELKPVKLAERTASASPNHTGFPLINYEKNQWSAQVGLAKKMSEKFVLSTSVNWDSGLGDPANALGPINGYWGVGLGFQYHFIPEWVISFGGKYLWLGDAEAKRQNGDIVGKFTNNDSIVLGLKLSYQKK